MHITTSKTKRMLFAPLLKTVEWLTPRCPAFVAKARYFARFKKRLNLKNSKDLNEKILWLAIFSDTREWSRLADKYTVREYVKECGLEDILVPFYGVWNNVNEVDYSSLPQSFIIKLTNWSASNIIVKDKKAISEQELLSRIEEAVKNKGRCTGVGDLHYLRIHTKIMAEGLIFNDEWSEQYSKSLIDYKIWCFEGKAKYIMLVMNRSVKKKDGAELLVYDRTWNPHPEYIKPTSDFTIADAIPMPENYEQMISIAEKLAGTFPVVRVDLYNLKGRIFFGEMTFTSLGGMMDYYTPRFLEICGDCIHFDNVSKEHNWTADQKIKES